MVVAHNLSWGVPPTPKPLPFPPSLPGSTLDILAINTQTGRRDLLLGRQFSQVKVDGYGIVHEASGPTRVQLPLQTLPMVAAGISHAWALGLRTN